MIETPDSLSETWATIEGLGSWPGAISDAAVALESLCDARPADSAASALWLRIIDALGALRTVPKGWTHRDIVCWDALTVTYVATSPDGQRELIRLVRADRSGPAALRFLDRQAQVLAAVHGAALGRAPGTLRLAIDGQPVSEQPYPSDESALRGIARAAVAVEKWSAAEVGLPALKRWQWRKLDDGVYVASLNFVATDSRGFLPSLGQSIRPWPLEGPLAAVQDDRGPSIMPNAIAFRQQVVDHLATRLTQQRHALVERWNDGCHHRQLRYLSTAMRRLCAAVPPPPGSGALPNGPRLATGRDDVTLVDGAQTHLVWCRARGVQAAAGRRLLRLRASAGPASATASTGRYVEALCRWTAAQLRLRTLSMLVQQQLRTVEQREPA